MSNLFSSVVVQDFLGKINGVEFNKELTFRHVVWLLAELATIPVFEQLFTDSDFETEKFISLLGAAFTNIYHTLGYDNAVNLEMEILNSVIDCPDDEIPCFEPYGSGDHYCEVDYYCEVNTILQQYFEKKDAE